MNFQNLFSRKQILLKVFNSHIVCYIVINSFFVSFEISGGSYDRSQNTLRLLNKFEKCIPSFMESLIDDFIQFSCAIAKGDFYFCKRDWAIDDVCTQFRDFTKISSFFKLHP